MSPEAAAREILRAATAREIELDMICNYRGYVKLNRSQFDKDLQELRRGLEKKLLGKTDSVIPDADEMSSFLRENAWLLSGFAAGWLIGFGLA
ncbi:hypothetical protein Q1695_005715 [Nippostrongylus brasiliensis]|nr:hypothetical protein Q1695_005715 [Nippostrongylus brasiliensis]